MGRDVCDGVLLINLFEILANVSLGSYHDKPQMTIQEKMSNLNTVVNYMNDAGIGMRGCSAEDILDGNLKLMLGMLWPVIYMSVVSPFDPRTTEAVAKKDLMAWCQASTNGYQGVRIDNFDSWYGSTYNSLSLPFLQFVSNIEKFFLFAVGRMGWVYARW